MCDEHDIFEDILPEPHDRHVIIIICCIALMVYVFIYGILTNL